MAQIFVKGKCLLGVFMGTSKFNYLKSSIFFGMTGNGLRPFGADGDAGARRFRGISMRLARLPNREYFDRCLLDHKNSPRVLLL